MKIAIGSDHAGFRYKQAIIAHLSAAYEVTDFGTDSEEPVDYPGLVRPVAEAVAAGNFERGIVLGGSGNGEAMAANRVRGIRCGLCWNLESGTAHPLSQRREYAFAGGADDGPEDGAGDRGSLFVHPV